MFCPVLLPGRCNGCCVYRFLCTLGVVAVRGSSGILAGGRCRAGAAQRLIVWQVLRVRHVLAVGSIGRVIGSFLSYQDHLLERRRCIPLKLVVAFLRPRA